jgi:hypothetical protein
MSDDGLAPVHGTRSAGRERRKPLHGRVAPSSQPQAASFVIVVEPQWWLVAARCEKWSIK